ncbi:alpha/beta hydrolase [Actinomycetospora soli]|uniref:alpha/beta hydrolase n=1 Tax=Actinomycetospora soli TaxID=2893887 RepID=UPI001E4A0DC6|nr:alpha/beta hydrolase [Actinomycetospora soli]MCD2186237.1 alpha/beta hydrolase [Actinomycetospora soli]
MTIEMDPEVAAAMAPIAAAAANQTPPPVGDWQTRRAAVDELLGAYTGAWEPPEDVTVTELEAPAADGTPIGMRLYRRAGDQPGSLAVYVHGGGMFLCSIDTHDPVCRAYTHLSGVPLLSVDFRFAPEHPYPTSVEDVYAALVWAAQHADELGVDPARIAIMGDSAGGGMAAGVALMARDRGAPALAAQILVYPMLDDRTTTPDPEIEPYAMWSTDDNITGWGCLLGAAAGGPDVPAYAAPSRATDLGGLPPAFIDVGQLDIFRNEDVDYAARLARAGVGVELQLHPGVPHAFEVFAPRAAVSQRAMAARVRALRSV